MHIYNKEKLIKLIGHFFFKLDNTLTKIKATIRSILFFFISKLNYQYSNLKLNKNFKI